MEETPPFGPPPSDSLPLHPLPTALPLDRPFTPAMARAVGIGHPSLDRMAREGEVRRLVRGAYASASAPDCRQLRAAALALVVAPEAVAVDCTAAWVHGVDVPVLDPTRPRPVEVVARGGGRRRGSSAGRRQLAGHDVQQVEGLLLTTPLRTALDLGRLLPPALALGAMDLLLAGGSFTHIELLAEVARWGALPGVGQLRALAAQVDDRSSCLAESVLRLRWNEALLPTPVPALPVCAAGRLVRLGLGVERRQFGAVLSGHVSGADLVALQGAGWRVVVLSEKRVLDADPALVTRHLEREFHQQLLAQTG